MTYAVMNDPKKYHHGNLHDVLIDTALIMLRDHPPHEISLRQLAQNSGVSNAAVYRHFKDKKELLDKLATVCHQQLAMQLGRTRQQYANDPLKQLTETSIAYISHAVQHPHTTRLMFSGITSAPAEEQRAPSDSSFGIFLDIVENGAKHGIYKNADTQMTALAIWSLLHGFIMLILGNQLNIDQGSDMKIQIIGRMLVDMLQNGILAPV